MLLLLCIALYLILRGDLYKVLPCVFFLVLFNLLALPALRLEKRELVCVPFRVSVCFARNGLWMTASL